MEPTSGHRRRAERDFPACGWPPGRATLSRGDLVSVEPSGDAGPACPGSPLGEDPLGDLGDQPLWPTITPLRELFLCHPLAGPLSDSDPARLARESPSARASRVRARGVLVHLDQHVLRHACARGTSRSRGLTSYGGVPWRMAPDGGTDPHGGRGLSHRFAYSAWKAPARLRPCQMATAVTVLSRTTSSQGRTT